jgi:hypothetical protein
MIRIEAFLSISRRAASQRGYNHANPAVPEKLRGSDDAL